VHDDGPKAVHGLVVTVTPAGAKVFYVTRKVRGRHERIRLGRVEHVSVETARARATVLNGEIAQGRSPAAERREVRAEMTLGELWETFKLRHAKKRSLPTDARRWKRHLAHWQSRKLSSVTRPDVVRLLDRITAGSGPGASNRTRALLHTLYEKAREWGADVSNPVSGSRRNPEHSKERYLSPDELRRFLAAVDEDHEEDAADFLRLLLFTGVRKGTLCAARWKDLALKDALWRIPAESMKAGRSLELPLAPAAVAILRKRQERAAPGGVWVFPGRSNGHTAGPGTGWVRVLERAEIAGVTMHDLRRTHATYALEAGVAMPMIARTLGHTMPGGVTAIYARPTAPQVRAGVERAVEYMLAVATGTAKVVKFPAARRR